jgi:hypothetical protein
MLIHSQGHFYETSAFRSDAKSQRGYTNLKKNCLNLIQGKDMQNLWRASGTPLDPDLFKDSPAAFIITPRADVGGTGDYVPAEPGILDFEPQIAKIEGVLKAMIPSLPDIKRHDYLPTPKTYDGMDGSVLFEYDPDSDGRGTPGTRLWVWGKETKIR